MVLRYDINAQLTDNFNVKEFHCKDGTPVPAEYVQNVMYIAKYLQIIRKYVGAIRINSGFRTVSHNRSIGGAINSNHLTARAVDICPVNGEYEIFKKTLFSLIDKKIIPNGEVIPYDGKKFIHYAPAFYVEFS